MSGSKVCAPYHSSTLIFEAKNLEKTGEGLKGSEAGELKGVNNKVRGCLLPPFLATLGLEAVLMSLLQGMWWDWSGSEGAPGDSCGN